MNPSGGGAETVVVHVSDLHLEPRETEQYRGVVERLQRIQATIRDIGAGLVVATGDLTNRGAAYADHFEMARRWLDGLDTPYLAVPGNHDLGANPERGRMFPEYERYEAVPFADTGYAGAFGADLVPRATAGPLTVLGVVLREDDPDDALSVLAAEIARAPGPVLVAGHYPVVETRRIPSIEHFGARGYVDRAAERLRELLAGSENVVAYLCGHVHLTSLRAISPGCAQFTAGGLGPGEASFRIYRVSGGSLHYSTNRVEGPRTFWEGGSAEARSIPYFSSGTEEERRGVLPVPASISHG
ncbi:metallophosphoesterase [Micromonospora sp. NPDC047074]|uniref:metallophosphoesterase family protein n=1 Tax=Micromonospora sp. NPDC047074 TaxID=3154339 RepID=UPI0033FA2CA3